MLLIALCSCFSSFLLCLILFDHVIFGFVLLYSLTAISSHCLTWLSLSQFIREYTGKVDELIKDKIEAQSEAKARENEEKDVMKQQVRT